MVLSNYLTDLRLLFDLYQKKLQDLIQLSATKQCLFIQNSFCHCSLFTWMSDPHFDLNNYPQLEIFLWGYIPVDLSFFFISHFDSFKLASPLFCSFMFEFSQTIRKAVWSKHNDYLHEYYELHNINKDSFKNTKYNTNFNQSIQRKAWHSSAYSDIGFYMLSDYKAFKDHKQAFIFLLVLIFT